MQWQIAALADIVQLNGRCEAGLGRQSENISWVDHVLATEIMAKQKQGDSPGWP